MKYLFGGDAEQTYPQFLDLATGRTLVAEPGRTYDIEPADGAPEGLAMPPDDRWTAPAAAKKSPKEND